MWEAENVRMGRGVWDGGKDDGGGCSYVYACVATKNVAVHH